MGAHTRKDWSGFSYQTNVSPRCIRTREFVSDVSRLEGYVQVRTKYQNGDSPLTSGLELAADGQGNVYVADAGDQRVRKIRVDGTIDMFAGTGEQGWSGEGGPASEATFDRPSRIAASAAGDVYVADAARHRIRKIDPQGGVSTVAGTGERGFSGDGGPATQARLDIQDIALDERGNLYVAHGDRIRRIDMKGIITTVAGMGRVVCSGDGGPATLAGLSADRIASGSDGEIWIADARNSRIRVLRRYGYS